MEGTSEDELGPQIDKLRDRLETIISSREDNSSRVQGFESVLRGLDAIFGDLQAEELSTGEETRLALLLRGIDGIVDHFTENPRPEPEPSQEELTGLKRFIGTFRTEGRKRLSGLSISMMSLFDDDASEALEQSAGHLHAMRGGAAMLGLNQVAELTGLMERVILAMRRVEPSERAWPTKALLRSYYLLEQAIDNPECKLDEKSLPAFERVRQDLTAALEKSSTSSSTTNPAHNVSIPTPDWAGDDLDAIGREHGDQETVAHDSDEINEGLSETTRPQEEELEQRILVVDDVDTIAASVAFVLSELDLDIDIANDGLQAIEMLKEKPYSLIISDVAMPRMTGLELTAAIRALSPFSDIPIILLTSLDHSKERQAGMKAGANDYIIKGSIGGGELVNRVRELLEIAPFFPAYTGEAEKAALHNILVAEDAETVAASIAFVLSEGPFDIVLARDGHDAIHKLHQRPFNLLISDAQMPKLDGFQLIERVRGQAKFARLPIVLLTSLDSDKVRQKAMDVGADRFLVKGEVGGGRLLDIVDELLEIYDR